MELNPMGVIIVATIAVIGIIAFVERSKRKKRIEDIEGVMLFGEKVTTNDFFSFCNTCVAYLMLDEKKTLDLATFIQEEKLKSNTGQESLHLIERTINMFPIVSCRLVHDAVFVVDEAKTIEKIQNYQDTTKSDDYIIPLFDVGLISRNPNLFTVSTRYQQAKTVEAILETRGIGDQFKSTETIKKGLTQLAENDTRYETPDVLYSDRNIQSAIEF